MPKLRGHHLICLHFFHGEGYDAEFVGNLMTVMDSLGDPDGEVEITYGPDDVCRKCPYLYQERCSYSDDADGAIERMDDRALSLLAVAPGKRTGWDEIRKKLPGAFTTWHASYCGGCDWRWACEKDDLYLQLLRSP